MQSSQATTIDLIRHGQPVGGEVIRGWRDDPLTEDGWQSMEASLAPGSGWTHVITSPLRRCSEFATAFAARHNLPLTVDPRLREIGYGAWEGSTRAEILARHGTQLHDFWHDPYSTTAPGGEAYSDFDARVREGWDALLEAHVGAHLLVVAHSGVIRNRIAEMLSMPIEAYYRIDIPKAGVSRIMIDDERGERLPRLRSHGTCL